MTDTDLASRLAELMCAAQRRYRTRRGVGCLVTPRIPDGLIDEFAVGLAPVLKQLAAEAMDAAITEAAEEQRPRGVRTGRRFEVLPDATVRAFHSDGAVAFDLKPGEPL